MVKREAAAIAALAVGQTLVWAALYYQFAGLVLVWERELGWTKDALALGLTLAVLVSAACAPAVGRAIDAGHGARLLGGGALLGAAMTLALAQAESRAGYLLAWAGMGAAQAACLYEACFAVVTRALGAAARPAITRITLAAGFASTLAFPFFAIVAEEAGWRAASTDGAAVVGLFAAPLLWAGARALPGGARPALAFPMLALNHGMLMNHLLPLLADRGASAGAAILAASLIGPMQVAGRVAMMLTERRASASGLALASYGALALAALALFGAGVSPALLGAFVVAQGAAVGVMSVLKPVIVADILGHAGYGAIAGWLAAPYLVGFALAPLLGAWLWRLGGWDLTIAAAAGLAAIGALALAGAIRRRDR